MGTKAQTKPRTVVITGRRWFERTNGNTYHTVEVVVVEGDGTRLDWKSDITYGYGSQYEQTAADWLASMGIVPKETYPLSRYFRDDLGVPFINTVTDVQRKKDL